MSLPSSARSSRSIHAEIGLLKHRREPVEVRVVG